MKPGYKQTDLGVLPEEWRVGRLSNLTFKIGSGITPTGGNKVYQTSGVPFVRSQNIGWGTLLLDDIAHISEEIHNTFASTEIKTKDVLLNITGASIGRSAIADKRIVGGNVNQHVCIIRTDDTQLIPGYLCAFLLSTEGQNAIDSFQTGGNRQGLNFEQIKSFQIPLPPPAEQQAIAEALGAVDALLTAQRGLLAKKRDLKQAAQQALLSGETRLPGFMGEWKVQTLGETGICVRGVSYNPETDLKPHDTVDTLRLLRSNNVAEGFVNFSSLQFVEQSRVKPAQIMRSNDILICMANGSKELVGKAGIFKPDNRFRYTFGAFMAAYRPNENICDPSFIFYQFQTESYRRSIGDLLAGSSINNLNPSAINSIEIQCPELDEQRAIAAILSDMDVELEALVAQIAKTQALKQGMMQDLLTGAVRLAPAAAALSTTLPPSTAA